MEPFLLKILNAGSIEIFEQQQLGDTGISINGDEGLMGMRMRHILVQIV